MSGIVHPHLRACHVDGKLAREARGIRVEDARANAPVREEVDEEVGLREVGGGVDALQKRSDSRPVMPSSVTPERPDTLNHASDTPMRSVMLPRMPTAAVMKLVSEV